jgi:hypothetical protein
MPCTQGRPCCRLPQRDPEGGRRHARGHLVPPPLVRSTYPVISWKAENVPQCNLDHIYTVSLSARRFGRAT